MDIKHSSGTHRHILVTSGPRAKRNILPTASALTRTAAILIILLFVAVALVAGNNNRASRLNRLPQTVTLSEAQAGNSITMEIGDTLQVVLEGNPSTGYSWSVEGLDAAILKSTGEPEFHQATDALGASGTVTSRFEAVGKGQTVLKMIYSRPFEKGTSPLRTFDVTVVITGR